MKDGPEGATVASRLEQVEVGTDEDGDAITSCIVVEVEVEGPVTTNKPTSMPKSARIALRALDEALGDAGEIAPTSNHIPSGAHVVSVNLWRQYAYQRGISAAESGDRAKQQAFKRASEHLVATGLVGIWGEQVWSTQ